MAYVNNYTPPPPAPAVLPESELYGPEPYDINFAYPIHASTLESASLKLVPFVPAVHGAAYWAAVSPALASTFRYYPALLPTLADTLAFVERAVRQNPHATLFAALDKTRADAAHPEWAGALAGIAGLFNTAPANLATELGFVVVFPAFRGTHVAKHMVGVLLRYVLELPGARVPGLGFRRVVWSAHPENAASIGLAERMGFRREGLLRWVWVLDDAVRETGKDAREDAFKGKRGRDSVVLSVCWDDWEGGVRERVREVLDK
ncbi:acyl-CoA N-acyltransferase [Dichomitus squalens LYAD-421 SS1]|uniref:Acyl-CoA N-acyltransferase n=2 Tax=Dichomitus squalens TaxID=114155 RepID=A0A4Q9M8F7_9APHY|nr:acyl-CoA N-acyltransferase [Dichomitus squalens LYAD-421 SS1]EJF61892.1 acyl-CoA N-acyltransferase [Dichomitus squalens LYAD-421 SS1]TBU23335.1 acyl-CoA N-acyltransferase [Dichomitus squalens]